MIKIYKCKRCGYEWAGRRNSKKPVTCANPKCRSAYWNKPKIVFAKDEIPCVKDTTYDE